MKRARMEYDVRLYNHRNKPKRRFSPRKITLALVGIVCLSAALFSIFISPSGGPVMASRDVSADLEQNVNDTLNGIDMGDLDSMVRELDGFNLFGSDSFGQRVGRILSGEFQEDYPNMFSALFALFGSVILGILPLVVMIIAVAILSGFINSLKHSESGDGVRNVIHFVTYAAVIILVMYGVGQMITATGRTLGSLQRQMDVIFPILLTLMVASGAPRGASVYQPAVAILSNGVMMIFTYIIMPLFIITLTFSVVGNISSTNKFDKFTSFFQSCYKWTLGLVFTIFTAFLTIQGITAGIQDGISLRAARFTVSSYVPYLGGYLSQGLDLVLASSILIKNAIGVAALYLMLGVVLGPLVHIIVFSLGLKLAAAVTQPIADERISNFLTSVNKSMSMLAAIIIGAAFMYFLTIGMIMMTGNVI